MALAPLLSRHIPAPEGVEANPSFRFRRERVYTWLAISTTIATFAVVVSFVGMDAIRVGAIGIHRLLADALLLEIALSIGMGQLVYECSRLGYLKRFEMHRGARRDELESFYDVRRAPALTILIPSYCENLDVVRATLMAAALAEYPNRQVTLLIDDPPVSSGPAVAALVATRNFRAKSTRCWQRRRKKYARELAAFQRRCASGWLNPRREYQRLSILYSMVAQWFEAHAVSTAVRDHVDVLFVKQILRKPAKDHRARALHLSELGRSGALSRTELSREYRRLAALFAVRMTSFERKRFLNLSHVANKAMNLNSYISLIGRSLRIDTGPAGDLLVDSDPERADFGVRSADYVMIVDADTLVTNDYAMRLVHELERPEYRRVAIAQSPHSPAPGASIPLQRAASAQNDVQRLINQGTTLYGASFWLGANGVLRYEALKDICEISEEGGYPICRYIKDRTAVEDTESTLDLRRRGWQIFNYPDPLAHSAEPPDFGSLIIQRRRWAGGGIVNFPKLVRYLWGRPQEGNAFGEAMVRLNYVLGIALSLGILLIPFLAFDQRTSQIAFLLILPMIAYYALVGRDVILCGYRWIDLARVLALGLLLLPVNLAGVVGAIWAQMDGGHNRKFSRTPKVSQRTRAPGFYILSAVLMLVGMTYSLVWNLHNHMWTLSALSGMNLALLTYAFCQYIGPREGWQDIVATLGDWMPSIAHDPSDPTPISLGESLGSEGGQVSPIAHHAMKTRTAAIPR